MWTKQCEHCDIYRDKPHDCCKHRYKNHDKRKRTKGAECFECSSIDFCKQKEAEFEVYKYEEEEIKCSKVIAFKR